MGTPAEEDEDEAEGLPLAQGVYVPLDGKLPPLAARLMLYVDSTTMASLIAARLAKIPPPPLGLTSRLPAQDSGPDTVERRASRQEAAALPRACQGEIGDRFCERLALPGTDLCEQCTRRAAAAKAPEGPEEWQQAVSAAVAAAHATEAG